MALYELTEEHREKLSFYKDRWTAIAFRTTPMTPEERELCVQAVIDMYALADLPAPQVVFAPSPLSARIATGFASWVAHTTTDKFDPADYLPTSEYRVEPDLSKWVVWPIDAQRMSVDMGVGEHGLECAKLAYRMISGGNQWADWPSMADFYCEVAKLDIDWTPWWPWRTLAMYSGPRFLHEKFCIISDFPTKLTIDDQNRPHNETGPFCEWSDGTKLYAWHGLYVPAHIIETPENLTIKHIDDEENAEIRRVMMEVYGLEKFMADSGAKIISEDIDEGNEPMRLLRREVPDDEPIVALHLRNSTPDPDGTVREYMIRVPPNLTEVWAARNWSFNLPPTTRMGKVS